MTRTIDLQDLKALLKQRKERAGLARLLKAVDQPKPELPEVVSE